MFVGFSSVVKISRLDAKASQIINIIIMTATNEMSDPIDDTVFQRV